MSGAENVVVDHLSRIEGPIDSLPIRDNFLDENLMQFHSSYVTPGFPNVVNFIVASVLPLHASRSQINKLKSDAKYYVLDDPYLWRFSSNQVICKCVCMIDHEIQSILQFYHNTPTDSHFGPQWTAMRILDYGFYWPTIFRDTHNFSTTYEQCQRAGGTITHRHEMPQQPIIFCEIFYVWGY